ncbi:hypothetical protein J7438_00005 [Thalassotalea sp. G20_0]|uniref:ZmpA/ZmpB/ZmpC family metallo-endopeptidase-related protein n=1 Tax=Thalassotalea sp. G20_0 TaxID=2821093 RepID=UPI001ADA0C60|nr:ZmpA/ZmpB/ZmpC family metallo-endopeptidase-related protein [Thalassotalea sp. G20_0]MBO9492482.1 hypothetical protein [Thalassotalea sp. G20_0]
MQPLSSTHAALSDVTANPGLDEPAKNNPTGTLGTFAVAVQSGVTALISSLSPNYVPEHQRQTIQPTTLAANTMSAENKNDKTNLVSNVLQGVGLASKAISCWVPHASAVSDAVGTLCSSFSLAHSLDNMGKSGKESGKEPGKESTNGSENESENHSQNITNKNREAEKPGKPVTASGTTASVSSCVSGPAIATVALMAMDRLAGASAQPAEGKPGSRNNPIPVDDSKALGKIGSNDNYPMDAHYQQRKSFSHNTGVPVGSETKPFKGHFDGGCHTISDLKDCLFGELGSGGNVTNLRIANTTINDLPKKQHSAVLACKMSNNSNITDVRVEHANVSTSHQGAKLRKPASIGVITGKQEKGSVLRDIEIVDCSVTSSGQNTFTGAGGGWVEGVIERMIVRDSQVSSKGLSSHAAIGGGLVTGQIKQLTVVNCTVTTKGKGTGAAIGGGRVGRWCPSAAGKVSELVALNSHVNTETENEPSFAAIGAGSLPHKQSKTNGITAIDCSVSASHNRSWVAIGAGENEGQVNDTTAVNSSVTGHHADIGQAGGSGKEVRTAYLNSWVNGKPKNFGNVTLPGLCRTADPRFVTSDCQLNPDSFTEDHWNCSSSPAPPGSVSQPIGAPVNETTVMADTTSQQPAMANTTSPKSSPTLTTPAPLSELVMSDTTITGHTITTPLTSINPTITTTAPLAMAAMTTTAPVTETVVTLPEASMTSAGMPSTLTLPTTPAPLVGTLSTGVALGVSLGIAMTILAGIGLCALYQYHRRNQAQIPETPLEPLINQTDCTHL